MARITIMLSTRMYTRLFTLTLLFVGFMTLSASQEAFARQADEEAAIRARLQQRETEIKAILGNDETLSEAQLTQLRTAVNDMFDFGSMGKEALGRHWDEISAAQQQEFVDVFAGIVRHQSLADVDIYRARVTYDTITVDGTNALVVTTTTYKDVPTEVVYKMVRSGNNWLATDVILDDVSTVDGYSRSFQSYIRKKGFDALMANLNKRLESTQNES